MPMLDHDKIAQLISHNLLADATVQSLVGPRVQGGWAADFDTSTIVKPALTFVLNGNAMVYEGVLAQVGVEVIGLSSHSASEALRVYRAAFDVLHAECLEIPNFDHRGSARQNSMPEQGHLTQTDVWYCTGRFILTVARDTSGIVE